MTISIKQLETEAIIGVYDNERIEKQAIIINIDIETRNSRAYLTDDINDTVDYSLLQRRICDFTTNSSFFLLETLGYRLMKMILEEEKVYKVYLEIHKPKALNKANVFLSYKGQKEKDSIIIY